MKTLVENFFSRYFSVWTTKLKKRSRAESSFRSVPSISLGLNLAAALAPSRQPLGYG